MSKFNSRGSRAVRKKLFVDFMMIAQNSMFEACDGFRHSASYVNNVLEQLVEGGKIESAVALLEQPHEMTSTRLGAVACQIAEEIMDMPQISAGLIDAEIYEDNIAFHFDSKTQRQTKLIERVLSKFGEVSLLAVPGDEFFDNVTSENFIFSIKPEAAVLESIEIIDEDEYTDEYEYTDEDEYTDEYTDEDEDTDIEEHYMVSPFILDDTAVEEALSDSGLTDEDINTLFELCYFGPSGDKVDEARRKPPKMKLRVRARKAGKSSKVSPKLMRTMMLRAMAQKGVLVHGVYKKKGVPALIRQWQKFKKKGAAAAIRSLMKGPNKEIVKAARKRAKAKAESALELMRKLPELNEDAMNTYIDSILEDMGLLHENDEDSKYIVTPFELTDEEVANAEDIFTDADVEDLYATAFAGETDEAKMKLRVRARKAGKGSKVSPKLMRTMMLRAMAQKGFINNGVYKKGGVPAKIKRWQKFKKKGAAAAIRALMKGPNKEIVKAARKSAKARAKA